MTPVCAVYYLLVIVSARCLCRPPLSFDDTDAVLPLTNQCSLIRSSLVVSPPIFGSKGIKKSIRNPSTLLVASAMMSCTIVGLNDGFFPCDNFFNLLKSYI